MKKYLIDFQNMVWESPAPGVRHKSFIKGNQKVRLVEFTEEFREEGWCIRGHVGYVLEGSLSIDFNGEVLNFRAGDGFFIPEGEENRHKGRVGKGGKALAVLFEKA